MTRTRWIKSIAVVFSVFVTVVLGACNQNVEEISAQALEERWDESIKHSAVSWWYLGTKDDAHFILERRPLEKHLYKVSVKDLDVANEMPLTQDESKWLNLKMLDLVFR